MKTAAHTPMNSVADRLVERGGMLLAVAKFSGASFVAAAAKW